MDVVETYFLTWNNFSRTMLNDVDMFEDPVYSTYVEREIFIDMYSKALETLDGGDMSSFVDFYFQSSPINQSIYIFRDENAKLDFMDIAIDCGLLPELEEVMAGETKLEKSHRNQQETTVRSNLKPKNQKLFKNDPIHKRSEQCEKTIKKLMERLQKETDVQIRQKLEKKIKQTLKHVDKSV